MRVFVTGATGLLGSQLCARLIDGGHAVTALSRREQRDIEGMRFVVGDPVEPGPWQDAVSDADAVVHLCGESVASGRWTSARKRRLVESRVTTTRLVVDAMSSSAHTLVSASATGFYGSRGDERLDEDSPPGHDFLADLCVAWEKEASVAVDRGVRSVQLRFGVVLAHAGGALEKMLPPFRMWLGGPLGPADRWFPWIHEADALGLAQAALEGSFEGPVNVVAPDTVRMGEFAAALGRALGRPAAIPVPLPLLRLALGEMGESLVPGQRVEPRKALAAGHAFQFRDLASALADLVG